MDSLVNRKEPHRNLILISSKSSGSVFANSGVFTDRNYHEWESTTFGHTC